MSEQTTCEPRSHKNVAWAGIPQTTHPGSYQLLVSPAKVGSSTEVSVTVRLAVGTGLDIFRYRYTVCD